MPTEIEKSLFLSKLSDIARKREHGDNPINISNMSLAAKRRCLSLMAYCEEHCTATYNEVVEVMKKTMEEL